MTLDQKIRTQLKKGALRRPPVALQGITKARIKEVLIPLARGTPDQIDAVFALLDDQTASWFSKGASFGLKVADGASTAHLACHIGVLQRSANKLDREGRDYWLKPLWEIGALEKVCFDQESGRFIEGHPVAKSPNSAYRIADSFRKILQAPAYEWPRLLQAWSNKDAIRTRLNLQAALAKEAKANVDTHHEKLIQAACDVYVPKFIPDFEIVYVDAGDGDRISKEYQHRLTAAGLRIELQDSMPDVLLWNKQSDSLWVIEAVTSDGEVDNHKVESLRRFATRNGKTMVNFTTVFATWKGVAARQGKYKNIAAGTYIWIQEDGSKQLKVDSYD